MASIIALAQCGSSDAIAKNLKTAAHFMEMASHSQASMIVFPEYFMISYLACDHGYVREAQSLQGSFVQSMSALARQYHLWVIFGMSERPEESASDIFTEKCCNTLVILDEQGVFRAHYRKYHLFDAFHWKESNDTIPGCEVFSPIDTPFGKLGLGTCYDLRFPELARKQAIAGAQLMIYPAAWVKGELKDVHWKTLLQARAIENSMYVIGCSQYTPDTYLGQSCAFDPMGRKLAEGGCREELLLATVNPEESDQARRMIGSVSQK